MIRNSRRLAAGLLAASMLIAPASIVAAPPAARHATAALRDATGTTVGWALFSETGLRGVRVLVVGIGLSEGLHGLHIHTTGSCVGPDFASAGPHFNPLNVLHGSHAGDLADLAVGPGGVGHLLTISTGFRLLPGPLSVFDADGAALVIHANPDDHVTNPSGNSGARVACGVLKPLGLGSIGLSGR